MRPRIVIIGSGNVAEALAAAITQSGCNLVQIYGRNRQRIEELSQLFNTPATDSVEDIAEAEIYLIAVSDRAIGEVCRGLNIPDGAVVAHTAGSIDIDAIPQIISHRAVFYPFQTFTAGRRVDFSSIPILIEASDEYSLGVIKTLAESLSRNVRVADSNIRRRVHLSGVFACNFTNAIYTAAESLISESGLSFDILKPLIIETAHKAAEAASPQDVQTGPALRGDKEVLDKHLTMLSEQERLKEIYKLISEQIWETSKRTLQK